MKYLIYFILKKKIETLKNRSIYNIREILSLICEHNERHSFFDKNYFFNGKYKTFPIEILRKTKSSSLFQTFPTSNLHVDPLTELSNKYDSSDIIIDHTLPFELKGIFCFLMFSKTKTMKKFGIYFFRNNEAAGIKIIDLLQLFRDKDPLLYKDIQNFLSFIEKKYDDIVTETNCSDLIITYVGCLSSKDENVTQDDIFDMIYKHETFNVFPNLHFNMFLNLTFGKAIYYKNLIQTNTEIDNTKRVVIKRFDKINVNNLLREEMEFLSNNKIARIVKNVYVREIDPTKRYLIYNYATKAFLFQVPNIKIFTFKNFDENMIIKYASTVNVEENNKNYLLHFNNKQIPWNGKTELKRLLYSNFLDSKYKINYNNIYIHNNNLYLPDIFHEVEGFVKHPVYLNLTKHFIICNYKIISKKSEAKKYNYILNVAPTIIDWKHFLDNTANCIGDENEILFESFKKRFKYYMDTFPDQAQFIILIFNSSSLTDLLLSEHTQVTKDESSLLISEIKLRNIDFLSDNIPSSDNESVNDMLEFIKIKLFLTRFSKEDNFLKRDF